jgi:hypothetical protein
MSTAQYALNVGLLVFILASNLGTRRLTRQRQLLPLALVVVAGWLLLRHVPTVGHDVQLEAVGLLVGATLGVAAGLLVRVRRTAGGEAVAHAGTGYAALWVGVIGGRMAFAYGADHWFPQAIGRFSMTHQITGADAWTSAFVIMALAMVVVRVAVTGLAARSTRSGAQVVAA